MSFQSAQKRTFSGPNEPDQIPISYHSVDIDPGPSESRPSIICPVCAKCFLNRSNLKRHIKNVHPTSVVKNLVPRPAKESLQYKCDECERQFSLEKNLRYHKRKQHSANILVDRLVLCPVCREEKQECLMVEHYAECHNILIQTSEMTFPSFEEFSVWKLNMEKETTSSYVRTGEHTNIDGTVKRYYRCHHSGNFSSKGRGVRHLKIRGSCKIDANCPAFFKLIITSCGQCKVEYQGTHAGHKADIDHIALSAEERASLASQIAAKIPFDTILNKVRNSVTDSKLKRLHLLTKKDLHNIVKSFDIVPDIFF